MNDSAQFELRLGRRNLPLGRTNIRAGTVQCDGLTSPGDFTVDLANNTVTIADHVTGDFAFFKFEHDQPIPTTPGPINAGADAPDLTDRTIVDTWLAATNTYIGTASPTAAETTAQVKRNARAIKAILRRVV